MTRPEIRATEKIQTVNALWQLSENDKLRKFGMVVIDGKITSVDNLKINV